MTEPDVFPKVLQQINDNVRSLLADSSNIIVKLDIVRDDTDNDFADWFCAYLPKHVQDKWQCRTCKRFLNHYGSLAVLTNNHQIVPLLWPANSNLKCIQMAYGWLTHPKTVVATVFDPVVDMDRQIGIPNRLGHEFQGSYGPGFYRHLFCDLPMDHPVMTPRLYTSETHPNLSYEMLNRACSTFSFANVTKAYQMITQNQLPNADKHKYAITSLYEVMKKLGHTVKTDSKSDNKDSKSDQTVSVANFTRLAILWRAAITLGSPVCHAIGAGGHCVNRLLKEMELNKSQKELEDVWSEMTNPLHYMRPTALPTEQTVKHAEQLFKKLGMTEADLKLYHVTDLPQEHTLWTTRHPVPSTTDTKTAGVFASVPTKQSPHSSRVTSGNNERTIKMSLKTFLKSVVPQAKSIDCKTERSVVPPIYGLVTGDLKTYPMLQWSTDTNRTSWFTLEKPGYEQYHNLFPDTWHVVTDICAFPHEWNKDDTKDKKDNKDNKDTKDKKESVNPFASFGDCRYLFILKNVSHVNVVGVPLFPEFLKAQFHPYRSVIEAYNKTHTVEPAASGLIPVTGVAVEKGQNGEIKNAPRIFRVTSKKDGLVTCYQINTVE